MKLLVVSMIISGQIFEGIIMERFKWTLYLKNLIGDRFWASLLRSIEERLRFENLKSKCWHIATASPSRFYLNNLTPVKQRKMAMIKYKFPLSNGAQRWASPNQKHMDLIKNSNAKRISTQKSRLMPVFKFKMIK